MPIIEWKKKRNLKPDVILKKLKTAASVREDGNVSYSAFEYMELMPAIYSMLKFGKRIDWSLKRKIVSKAINISLKNSSLNSEELIKEINKQLIVANKTRENEYILLTSLSIAHPLPIKKIEISNCTIRIFEGVFPKKYSSRRQQEKKWNFDFPHTPDGYSKVIVKCRAKFPHEAVRKSLEAIDLLRAFLSLFVNFRMQFSFGIDMAPINKIRLGGMHTLHKNNGSTAVDYFWYEPNFKLAPPHSIPQDKIHKISKSIKWSIGKYKESKYRHMLLDPILRYVRALDDGNANTAALKLWGALESIAAPGDGNYDAVTRRGAFLFKDGNYHKQMLEHLREYRNSNVHDGEEFEEAKTCCYQMQYYFFELILFHLRNADVFHNMQEANMFLDLPSSHKDLQLRKKLIEKAIEFIS